MRLLGANNGGFTVHKKLICKFLKLNIDIRLYGLSMFEYPIYLGVIKNYILLN